MNDAKIREFCIRKVAQILYDCVACSESDRAEIDWHTAENFIKKHHVDHFTILANDHNVKTWEDFDRELGRFAWENFYRSIKWCLPPVYTKILFH